eukprot:TRINITY_DN605_c0_g2_i1.p3 TRINITY_DN605_c0_g2~~TRINITY_DN605_c0_g2_i1.p3  ORF type:complete len:425 (+),score=24.15 TRINITY_DN605_c0_g2_i1:178-1275(+)
MERRLRHNLRQVCQAFLRVRHNGTHTFLLFRSFLQKWQHVSFQCTPLAIFALTPQMIKSVDDLPLTDDHPVDPDLGFTIKVDSRPFHLYAESIQDKVAFMYAFACINIIPIRPPIPFYENAYIKYNPGVVPAESLKPVPSGNLELIPEKTVPDMSGIIKKDKPKVPVEAENEQEIATVPLKSSAARVQKIPEPVIEKASPKKQKEEPPKVVKETVATAKVKEPQKERVVEKVADFDDVWELDLPENPTTATTQKPAIVMAGTTQKPAIITPAKTTKPTTVIPAKPTTEKPAITTQNLAIVKASAVIAEPTTAASVQKEKVVVDIHKTENSDKGKYATDNKAVEEDDFEEVWQQQQQVHTTFHFNA